MSTPVPVIATWLAQSSTVPGPFRLSDVTVMERAQVTEIDDLMIASYLQLGVRSEDGSHATVHVPMHLSGQYGVRIRLGDVCTFEGIERPWRGDRPLTGSALAPGEPALIASTFECRPPIGERAPDPFAAVQLIMPIPPEVRSADVTIVEVGQSPEVPSGHLHTATRVLGQTDEGEIRPYYMTFRGPRYPVPQVGRRCALHHSTAGHTVHVGPSMDQVRDVEVFWEFECEPAPSTDGSAGRHEPGLIFSL
ncbi:hypothetical protein [Brevundimonas sp. FT23028]|uniref:hypothetical protein n=1 Tax=Brevundimonas sp. FT23028 TaxID=3393748 RepID=UPI003B586909